MSKVRRTKKRTSADPTKAVTEAVIHHLPDITRGATIEGRGNKWVVRRVKGEAVVLEGLHGEFDSTISAVTKSVVNCGYVVNTPKKKFRKH